MNSNKKRMPNIPLSIDGAAKALDIDREYILTWLLDGSIRACINYRTYFSDSLTYSVAVLSDYTNIMEEFKRYRDDEFSRDCPLSSLLSTVHSTISINAYSVPLKTNDNGTSFSADLKGLWHINELTDVEELYDNMINDNSAYVNIIPYIPDSIYNSGVNGGIADYILGFNVEVSFDDLCISYEDIRRIDEYLSSKGELGKVNSPKQAIEPKFTSIQQLAMVFIQLIESDSTLGSRTIKIPHSSLEFIERIRSRNNYPPLAIDSRAFGDLISLGKRLFDPKQRETEVMANGSKKPKKLTKKNSETLLKLIESHPLFSSETIDDPTYIYEIINNELNLEMELEVFVETLNTAKNY